MTADLFSYGHTQFRRNDAKLQWKNTLHPVCLKFQCIQWTWSDWRWGKKFKRTSFVYGCSPSRSASTVIRRLCLCGNLRSVAEQSTSRPRGPANYFPLVHSVHMIPHYLADTRWRKLYPRNQSKVKPPPPHPPSTLTVQGTPRCCTRSVPVKGKYRRLVVFPSFIRSSGEKAAGAARGPNYAVAASN